MSDDERANARLEGALSRLGAELSPPAGWQARVLAAAKAPRPSFWQRWWKLALPAIPAAAAVAAVLLWARHPRTTELELVVDVAHSTDTVRGDSARVGDLVTATATGGGAHRAVWIYRDERRLVLACPGAAAGCSSKDGATVATLELELPGFYTLLALTSPDPLPAPTDSYDASVAAAQRAGATVKPSSLRVQ